jgi:hypothetical protein
MVWAWAWAWARLPTKLNEMGVISSVLVYGVLWVRRVAVAVADLGFRQ